MDPRLRVKQFHTTKQETEDKGSFLQKNPMNLMDGKGTKRNSVREADTRSLSHRIFNKQTLANFSGHGKQRAKVSQTRSWYDERNDWKLTLTARKDCR